MANNSARYVSDHLAIFILKWLSDSNSSGGCITFFRDDGILSRKLEMLGLNSADAPHWIRTIFRRRPTDGWRKPDPKSSRDNIQIGPMYDLFKGRWGADMLIREKFFTQRVCGRVKPYQVGNDDSRPISLFSIHDPSIPPLAPGLSAFGAEFGFHRTFNKYAVHS